MQNKDTIPFEHWSLKVGRVDPVSGDPVPLFGEIVTAVDDLHQSITNLILTPLGSVPTEPEKGCDITPYLDRHVDIAIPNITRVIWDALTMWEPRIVLQEIKVSEIAFGHLSAEVHWRPVEGVLDDLRITGVALFDQSPPDQRVA